MTLSIAKPFDSECEPIHSLRYLPFVTIGSLAVWYVMHWGQLHGWLEAPGHFRRCARRDARVQRRLMDCLAKLRSGRLARGLPRLALIAYGGFVQYFNATDMGVYGGLLINFSPLMRSWLVWSLSIGAATAYVLDRFMCRTRPTGYTGAAFGLLVLAGGMWLSHQTTLSWPYWRVLNTFEFNWFVAPQHWQLAPAAIPHGLRQCHGAPVDDRAFEPQFEREAKFRPFLQVAQFMGGRLSIGVLVTTLIIQHQIQYSYVADRGFIQSVEQSDQRRRLVDALTDRRLNSTGSPVRIAAFPRGKLRG